MPQTTLDDRSGDSVRSIMEFPLRQGKLVLGLQGESPAWAEPALKRLGSLLLLPQNWDSYGGRPIDPACAWAAFQLLATVLPDDSGPPTIVPTQRGGIQIEWHASGADLEIEIVAPGRYQVSFENAAAGTSWEKELGEDLREVVSCLSQFGLHRNGAKPSPRSGE